ncbi:hypothetical protein DL93DRAFT_2151264 [Clavulina sp. PMI_390]|nr:hypothetical protein DL93DRAFT_2151264 [Clavulina sp. PMI_390]
MPDPKRLARERSNSKITWDSTKISGDKNISSHFAACGFLACLQIPGIAYTVTERHFENFPEPESDGILLTCSGTVTVENDSDNPRKFKDVFQYPPVSGAVGAFYIADHVFTFER